MARGLRCIIRTSGYGLLLSLLLGCAKHGAAVKTVRDFEDCLEYVNRLGIVNKTKPIGWRQSDLCAIVTGLERIAGFHCNAIYPFTVTYKRGDSFQSLVFVINGGHYRFTYPDANGRIRCIT